MLTTKIFMVMDGAKMSMCMMFQFRFVFEVNIMHVFIIHSKYFPVSDWLKLHA